MKSSPLTSLLTIADEILTAGELIRDQQLTALSLDMPVATGRAQLEDEGFDVAPLTHIPITHYVHIDDLGEGSERPLREFARKIVDEERIPEQLPLSETLEVLRERPFVFVHHRHHITGIVTRADIGRPQVGLLTFGMIVALENAIDELIETSTDEDDWFTLLSEERRARVEEIYEERRATNTELDRLNCLNLDDRLSLARKLGLGSDLGFDTNKALRGWKKQVGRIRDGLAHGDTLLNAVPEPLEALAVVTSVRRTATAAWTSVQDRATSRRSPNADAPG